MKIILEHVNNKSNWDKHIVKDPKTLILGSFNPYNPKLESQTEFYYSRTRNRFWSTIGNVKYENRDYFRNSLKNKIDELQSSKFILMDLIESIEFECDNESVLQRYINNKVLRNFGDNDIWVTKKRTNPQIHLRRIYNQKIIHFLKENNSVIRIVNTLGQNKGDLNSFNKSEQNWNEFKKSLFHISKLKNIELVTESVSPSPRQNTQQNQEMLKSWVKKYILHQLTPIQKNGELIGTFINEKFDDQQKNAWLEGPKSSRILK